jgi:Flp pilus assembly protein TadD
MISVGAIHAAPAAGAVNYLVFPPENLSSSTALAWVGESLALSIAEQLRVPGVEALGREDRLSFVEGADLPPNVALSRASMIHVAQQASADRLVMGSYTGSDENLQITLRVLDVKAMKLGGEIVVGGPAIALPQMENELAWVILTNAGLNKIYSREKYRERTRSIPNAAYSCLVQSFSQVAREEQVKLLSKAIELYPDFPEAHSRLGTYYYQQGDCARSIQHLELAGGRRETHLDDQFKLGSCYLRQGDPQGAIRSFAAILAFAKSPQVMNNLGVAYLRKGDYTLAAQNLIEARNAARTEPTILTNLAIVRHLQEDYASARAILEDAAKLDPSRGMVQFMLGMVLRKQGEEERATAAMTQARRLGVDPEKLRSEDPKSWARPFTTWSGKP